MEVTTVVAIDSGGITRHIARPSFRHPILSEPTTARDWSWVLRSLWRPGDTDKLTATLIDSFLYDAGVFAGWFFTAKDGTVMKKSERNCTADQIKAAFTRHAQNYADARPAAFAQAFSGSGDVTLISEADFPSALAASFNGASVVQPYTAPRGGSLGPANYRHEFSVYGGVGDGTPVSTSYRYADATVAESNKGSGRPVVISRVQHVNEIMEAITINAVRFIQASRKLRVTKFVGEFCHDVNGRVWLVSTSEVLTVPPSKTFKPERLGASTSKLLEVEAEAADPVAPVARATSVPSPKLPRTMSFATAQSAIATEDNGGIPPAVQAAMEECIQCFSAVTVNDILELRSFVSPPPAVALVTCALTLLLTGEAMDWRDARRVMANGDKLYASMAAVRPDAIPKKRLASLQLLVDNPAFAQEYLRPVSMAAARVGCWVSSVAKLTAVSKGVTSSTSVPSAVSFPRISSRDSMEPKSTPGKSQLSFAEKLKQRVSTSSATKPVVAPADPSVGAASIKRKTQRVSMARLAATGAEEGAADAEVPHTFSSVKYGVTLPYMVVGRPHASGVPPLAGPASNIVFIHDLFDTYEASQIFLRPVCRASGQQALVFNYPLQAFTSTPSDTVVNNDSISDVLAELLHQLHSTGEFCYGPDRKIHVVGVGFGGNIALSFMAQHVSPSPLLSSAVSGVTLVNAFAALDSQLTAIMHSSVNVFSCFPPSKPELALSYFSRFLFSEAFVTKMSKEMAMNMYSAVANPLSSDDRVKLCNAVLRSVDNRPHLASVRVPLIVIQSLDDVLVSVSNADTILHDAVDVKNVWPASMDDEPSGSTSKHIGDAAIADSKSMKVVADVLNGSGSSACALWVQCGHEIRLEARKQLMDVIALIAHPTAALVSAGLLALPAAASDVHTGKKTDGSKTSVVAAPVTSLRSSAPALPPSIHPTLTGMTSSTALPDTPTVAPPLPFATAGVSMSSLLAQQASTEAAFKATIDDQKRRQEEFEKERLDRLARDQEERRVKWEKEDQARLEKLRKTMSQHQQHRHEETANLLAFLQKSDSMPAKRPQQQNHQPLAVKTGVSRPTSAVRSTAKSSPKSSPKALTYDEVLGKLTSKEEEEKKLPLMRYRDYQRIQADLEHRVAAVAEEAVVQKEDTRRAEAELRYDSAVKIQSLARGRQARKQYARMESERELQLKSAHASTKIQAAYRGKRGREKASGLRAQKDRKLVEDNSIVNIQRMVRGHQSRGGVRKIKQEKSAVTIQKVVRGRQARVSFAEKRAEAQTKMRQYRAATKIQAAYRMHVTFRTYKELQILAMAAVEVQRVWRGYLGRQRFKRKKTWQATAPGPDRLKLGMQILTQSKDAYDRQKHEIESLHRAKARAETRVTAINIGLQESESELATIQRELSSIDQLEAQVLDLARQESKLKDEMDQLATFATMNADAAIVLSGKNKRLEDLRSLERAMADKRAEREIRKQELEAEFSAVFSDIREKKSELKQLEEGISDMESQRLRKDREFNRLQRNLMELLAEQKAELDAIREKGLQLESATATSAAAAAETAQLAQANQAKSEQMYRSTEDLLKFQFMSMSMSYFSSLNMLTGLRQMNADTSSSAIKASAETAATAAATAAAAAIPLTKRISGAATVDASSTRPNMPTAASRSSEIDKIRAIEAAKRQPVNPLPSDVHKWSVEDVGMWLESLSLSQYKAAFAHGAVDGDFLMELRSEDIRDILGVDHPLHVRKIITSREKLMTTGTSGPAAVNMQGLVDAKTLHMRPSASGSGTENEGSLDVKVVFSQARNGRIKRLADSLALGFDVNATDDTGNTLLLIGAQNVSRKICEMVLDRGANVNHANKSGNTALHFAFSYDPSGQLAEFLIDRGADDTITNSAGATPYDGIDG